jgi:DNA-binding GntR family transcriptional regulator
MKQRLTKSERASRIEDFNYRFHRIINRVPDAPRLRWFLRATTRYVPRHFYQAIPEWTDATLAEHPEIIEALRKRQGKAVRNLVQEHIESAGRMVVDYLEAKGFWSEPPAKPADNKRQA